MPPLKISKSCLRFNSAQFEAIGNKLFQEHINLPAKPLGGFVCWRCCALVSGQPLPVHVNADGMYACKHKYLQEHACVHTCIHRDVHRCTGLVFMRSGPWGGVGLLDQTATQRVVSTPRVRFNVVTLETRASSRTLYHIIELVLAITIPGWLWPI